jgi:hypothetical protein
VIDLNTVFTQLAPKLARVINENFPHRCSIVRPTSTTTAYRTQAPGSPTTVASNVGCSFAPGGKDAKEYLRANKIVAQAPYAVTLPAQISGVAVDVKPKDRIVTVATDTEVSHTFEVLGPPLRNGGLSLFVVCTLEES